MSAYMVDREHVQYLVEAAMSRRLNPHGGQFRWHFNGASIPLQSGDYDTAARVGQMLWDENKASIMARYPDTANDFSDAPGPIGESYQYGFHRPMGDVKLDPVQILKSCSCYEYQSCEHEGWKSSQAKAFIDSLKKHAINALPGYDDAEWGAPKTQKRSAVRAL